MHKMSALALLLPLFALPAYAQDVAPAAPTAPAGDEAILATVAPAMPADPNDLLTGLYATQAVAELCEIAITPEVDAAMVADEARYVEALNITAANATLVFDDIKSALEANTPDCAAGSPDVVGVTEVLDLYASAPAAPSADTDVTVPAETPAQ